MRCMENYKKEIDRLEAEIVFHTEFLKPEGDGIFLLGHEHVESLRNILNARVKLLESLKNHVEYLETD